MYSPRIDFIIHFLHVFYIHIPFHVSKKINKNSRIFKIRRIFNDSCLIEIPLKGRNSKIIRRLIWSIKRIIIFRKQERIQLLTTELKKTLACIYLAVVIIIFVKLRFASKSTPRRLGWKLKNEGNWYNGK